MDYRKIYTGQWDTHCSSGIVATEKGRGTVSHRVRGEYMKLSAHVPWLAGHGELNDSGLIVLWSWVATAGLAILPNNDLSGQKSC